LQTIRGQAGFAFLKQPTGLFSYLRSLDNLVYHGTDAEAGAIVASFGVEVNVFFLFYG
jgi:hypothetical protein